MKSSADEQPSTGAGRPGAPRRAVALRYDPEGEPGSAPRVVASGAGEAAERILLLAAEHGVPVRRDGELLELLAQCDLGREIPLELYAAVAEVLAYLLRVNAEAQAPGRAALEGTPEPRS